MAVVAWVVHAKTTGSLDQEKMPDSKTELQPDYNMFERKMVRDSVILIAKEEYNVLLMNSKKKQMKLQ